MKQAYWDVIKDQVRNWSYADVRTVPGVMIQICCGLTGLLIVQKQMCTIIDLHAFTTRFLQGNIFDPPKILPSTLCHVKSRHHFPGNVMHVATNQFHSISPVNTLTERVLTFLVKKHIGSSEIFILNTSSDIQAPKEEI
ncbi:hypothetical protein I4U23_022679 [Adineta vaga]|nr:hypothetical protein I4U23_022679 [Adineta vaga]